MFQYKIRHMISCISQFYCEVDVIIISIFIAREIEVHTVSNLLKAID
jgi:hypothetical protein